MPSQPTGNLTTFASRLRAVMLEERISIQALSVATGISVRLIAKYRAGQSEPRDYYGDPSDNARKIADALGVDVAMLLPADRVRPQPEAV